MLRLTRTLVLGAILALLMTIVTACGGGYGSGGSSMYPTPHPPMPNPTMTR